MKITLQQLRKIILENLEFPTSAGYATRSKKGNRYAHPEFNSKEELKRFILKRMQDYGRLASPESVRQFGTQYDDYNTEEGRFLRDMRKYPKAIWNKFADHEYFKNNIAKLHQVDYAGTTDRGTTPITRQYLSGGKTELSVWGTSSNSPTAPSPQELKTVANQYSDSMARVNIYLALEGRVTWAGDFDAFTEELQSHRSKKDSENDEKRKSAAEATTSSGMPKRPGGISLRGGERDFRDFPIILDREDVEGMEQGLINEMIIDNWSIRSTILYIENLSQLSIAGNTIDQIVKKLNDYANNTSKMSAFHKLLQAKKDGFPNPQICDYEAGRYYTQEELNSLFSKLSEVNIPEIDSDLEDNSED